MPYIIGTAGHIDHGKTSLIKALTGQDTDRLKEEKERGISIDLGFAYLDLPDGTRAGIVDVPGHERFIRNMLAGAHGIDLALFTVAADDGIMPQTEEHLDILHLLGVHRAIFVLTKTDLAAGARIAEVEEDIRILTAGTSLENSPIIPFSSVTGAGLDQLRECIVGMLREGGKQQPSGYFRLPVDRAFALHGHGLVVTGTAQSGEVRVEDRVRRLPGGELFRVRSIQIHNEAVESGRWGQRIALNLAGQESWPVERGDVICHEAMTRTSDRFDAFVEVRPAAASGLKSHQRVRVHLGTAERIGKVIVLGPQEAVGPKESAYCQIVTTQPVLAVRGDRFVIRDETSSRTLGGGVIIHPWAIRHKKQEPGLRERLEVLHRGGAAAATAAFLSESSDFAVSIDRLREFLNLDEEAVRRAIAAAEGVRAMTFEGERLYTTDAKWQDVREELLQRLKEFHAAHPLAPGFDMEEAREKLSYDVSLRLFRGVIEQLEKENTVVRDGNVLKLPTHRVRLDDREQTFTRKIASLLGANPLAPPELKQIETETGLDRRRLGEIMRLMERDRSVVRVSTDMYFLAESIGKLKTELCEYLSKNGQVTPATFRDRFGTTRKYTIPLLEYFDRDGVTIRVGDARRLRRAPAGERT